MMSRERIYLCPPHMGGDELGLVEEAFTSNWLSTVGPHLSAFEQEMGQRMSVDGVPRHCVALASGTAALHLGLRALGVEAGDDVLCPTTTFVASANPIRYLGAEPVFVDSERDSWNLDPDRLKEAIADRTKIRGAPPKALVVVHLYGQTANMHAIDEVCAEAGVAVLEDAAEALGATHEGRPAGALAPIAAFSFNGNKIITSSGGGMLVCADEAVADRARHWSTQAREPGVAYEHVELGYNYRMSNVLAAIGRGQLRVLDKRVEAHRELFETYASAFEAEGLEGLDAMPEAEWGTHTRWLSTFVVDEARLGCTRDALLAALAEQNIEARPTWKPMHMQPLFAASPMYGGEVAEDLFRRGICLPSGSAMTPADARRVIDTLVQTVRR